MPSKGDTTRPVDLAAFEQIERLRLLVLAESGVETHLLPESGSVTIGRGEGAEIVIDDSSISREHARIYLGEAMAVADLGSTNGTRVRGQSLGPDVRVGVAPGDVIEVGTVAVVVQGPYDVPTVEERDGADQAQPDPMAKIEALVERVAGSTINVLLLGETGVGKEVLARRIHELSPRADEPFMGINCAALSEQLLESELFGHERGAFTSAVQTKPGLLELARGGTLFLDEIGDLPIPLQAKLLRVLEERMVRRVGGVEGRAIEARFIAATNRDLRADVVAQNFRRDLFFRLNGVMIEIPPLRDRIHQITDFARQFIADAADADGGSVPTLSAAAVAWLRAYAWPGNLRELKNMMERAVLLCDGDQITVEHLPESSAGLEPSAHLATDGDERQRIIDALDQCAGNQTRAAKLLGIGRRTLIKRLDAYGLPRPRKGVADDDD